MTLPKIVLVATRNAGKAAEFARMLGGDAGTAWQDLSAYPDAGDVEETGRTFHANACLKATEYAKRTGQWALADDSGLEVDALDGAPGVYSARFAAMYAEGDRRLSIVEGRKDVNAGLRPSTIDIPQSPSPDAANNQLLLDMLDGTPNAARTARFVCVLALADAAGRIILTARDTVEGHIMHTGRGTNGFGYDPLFEVSPGRSMAELSPAEKSEISHRGRALRRLKELMRRPAPAGAPEGPL